jgi:hypothetical protein
MVGITLNPHLPIWDKSYTPPPPSFLGLHISPLPLPQGAAERIDLLSWPLSFRKKKN